MAGILEGKVALVTGVSHDGQVGQAVAKALAERGASLTIAARSAANVEARGEELRKAGAKVLAVAASLTDEAQVASLIERTKGDFGRLDIVVNLAGGLTRYKPATEFSLDDWSSELNNNLLSALPRDARRLPAAQGQRRRLGHQLRARRFGAGQHGCVQLRQGGRRSADAHVCA